jgi:hypothetical protein
MRVALFTPFSPEIGGGSVQLRSHIEQMPGLDVEWYYLSPEPVRGAHRHWLGQPLSPAQLVADLSTRTGFLPGSTAAVRTLVGKMEADLYWVVAHYEGISVAAELLSMGKTVHLTVHDEPLAMLMMSRRFRPLWPLMSLIFPRVLRSAKSVDVTSTAMRDYYKQKYAIDCFALYMYLPELPVMTFAPPENTLSVGHIGSLYYPDTFRHFIRACREHAVQHNRGLRIVRIGSSASMDKIAFEYPGAFESYGQLSQGEALPALATCHFVYAMYPDGIRFKGFRRTSLPVKLSSYIQAQRPIFAHTPCDSGLARLVAQFDVGKVCSSNKELDIGQTIRELMNFRIPRENFERLRSDLMGASQIHQLRDALTTNCLGEAERSA